jgi:hypothetical protein
VDACWIPLLGSAGRATSGAPHVEAFDVNLLDTKRDPGDVHMAVAEID